MSTTSIATALAAHNHIPGNEVELLNHMCVLELTRSDGTPFNVAFIQEEDIVEFCVELGQTPQRCVLVLSNWVSGFISFHRWNAGHDTWSYQSYGFMWGNHSASHVSLLNCPCEGLCSNWEMDALQVPTLWPQIGRRFLNHPIATPNQMRGPCASIRWILGTLGMPS